MRIVRRLTLMTALLGSIATFLAGGVAAVAAALSAAIILGSLLALPQPTSVAIERWRLINLTGLITGMIAIAVRLEPLSIVAAGLALLAAHRAWTATQASGLQALLLITVLQVMLAERAVVGAWGAVLLGLLVVLAPAALALISLRRWRLRTAGLGVAVGAIGLGIAAALPTPEGASTSGERHTVGFSREVSLGDLGPLHDDPTIVLSLIDDRSEPAYYLHGITLDRFTGAGWVATAAHASAPLAVDLVGRALLKQRITLQPLTEGVLLGRAPIATIEGLEGAWRDEDGTWRSGDARQPVQYSAYSLTEPVSLPLKDPGRWRALPADLEPQLRALASQLTIDGTAQAQADHLIDWLRREYTYTRIPASGTTRQSLSDFLFVTRTGHCEYFATTLAVLLRLQGHASRVVNGLRGGAHQDDGSIVFRQRDAHAWVELHVPGVGWQRLEPTPPEQAAVAAAQPMQAPPPERRSSAPSLPILLLLGLLAGAALLAGVRRRRPADPALQRYHQALKLARSRGWDVPRSLPPVSAAEWLIAQAGRDAEAMRTLAWALYRYRYGGEVEALGEMESALKYLESLPRRG